MKTLSVHFYVAFVAIISAIILKSLMKREGVIINLEVKCLKIEPQLQWKGRQFCYIPNTDTHNWIAYGFVNLKMTGEFKNSNYKSKPISASIYDLDNYKINASEEQIKFVGCASASTLGFDDNEKRTIQEYHNRAIQDVNIDKTKKIEIDTTNLPISFYMWQTKDVNIDYTKPVRFHVKFSSISNHTRVISNDAVVEVYLPVLKNDANR